MTLRFVLVFCLLDVAINSEFGGSFSDPRNLHHRHCCHSFILHGEFELPFLFSLFPLSSLHSSFLRFLDSTSAFDLIKAYFYFS
jgi:hypothetical protein